MMVRAFVPGKQRSVAFDPEMSILYPSIVLNFSTIDNKITCQRYHVHSIETERAPVKQAYQAYIAKCFWGLKIDPHKNSMNND